MIVKPLSIVFEKLWLPGKGTGKRETSVPLLRKVERKTQSGGASRVPEKISVNIHERQGGNTMQSVQLHQGQIMPNQSGGLLHWCDNIGGQR